MVSPPFSLSFFLKPPPPFFFRSASRKRQKALLGPYRFDFFTLPPANGIFSVFSFPFFGIVALSLESSSSSSEAIHFSPDIPVVSSSRLPEPAEPCRPSRARFGAAGPSGRRDSGRRFPPCPAHSSASPAPRLPPPPPPRRNRPVASGQLGQAPGPLSP